MAIKKFTSGLYNKYIGKIECPNCKSMNTVANSLTTTFIGYLLISIMCFCFSMFIPYLGWVLAPIFLLIVVISLVVCIIGILSKTYSCSCRKCKEKFKVNKKEFKKILSSNKN